MSTNEPIIHVIRSERANKYNCYNNLTDWQLDAE